MSINLPQKFQKILSSDGSCSYPFAISKSALHAVGSPHTWPALLGALNWLHELLTYDEEAEVKRVENEQVDVDAEGNRIFFDYLERTYESFLAGKKPTTSVVGVHVYRLQSGRSDQWLED